ncbi:MAG: nucleoside 2-deoxyribosyltransferase [Bacteroidota bacterium]
MKNFSIKAQAQMSILSNNLQIMKERQQIIKNERRTKNKIYVASPLGFSEAGRLLNEKIIKLIQQLGGEVLDPWTLTPEAVEYPIINSLEPGIKKLDRLKKLNALVADNNEKAIRDADLILAVLDGVDVDSGTASEIGYAAALGKPVYGYKGDFRVAGDNEGAVVNLQVEFFILKKGQIVYSLEELKTLFTKILN